MTRQTQSHRRNYPLLLGGQFLGAFGDQAILAVLLGPLLFQRDAGLISGEAMRHWNILFTVLLFVPCVVFAPLAGFCNDRFPKSACLVAGNAIKLAGAILCMAGLFFGGEPRTVLQAAGYFIVGAGTCLYGPGKYGILAEILPRKKLVRANGMVELLTLLAILGGVAAGSALSDIFRDNLMVPHGIVAGIYAVALVANAAMSRTPDNPAVRLRQTANEFFRHLKTLVCAPRTRLILAGTSLFWVIGAAIKSHLQPWGEGTLGLRNNMSIALLAIVLSVGIMVGSLTAGRLRKVGDLGGVPRMGIVLAFVLAATWAVGAGPGDGFPANFLPNAAGGFGLTPVVEFGAMVLVLPVVVLLLIAGFFAGLFLIPLNAALQAETDPEKLGKTIAVQNLFDYLGMCGAGLYLAAATATGISLRAVFLGLAFVTLSVAVWMATRPCLRTPIPE